MYRQSFPSSHPLKPVEVEQWGITVLVTPSAYIQILRLFRELREMLQMTPK